MSWIIKLVFLLLLTSMTGSVIFATWYIIGKILERMGYITIMYKLLRLSLIFWFFPLVYLVVFFDEKIGNDGSSFLFYDTEVIFKICAGLISVWAVVVVCNCINYIISVIKTRKLCANSYECEVELQSMFNNLCNQLNISHNKISIRKSYSVPIPICIGIHTPMVIIPEGEYDADSLRVIIIHELIHYKHKDQWLKHIAFIASCIHCFNPIIFVLKRKIKIWAEYACDSDAVEIIGSQKDYFTVVLSMANSFSRFKGVYSSLVEQKNDIVDRMEHMKRSKNMSIKNRGKAIVCIVAMFVFSTTTVYAGTNLATNKYLDFYNSTVEDVEISQRAVDDTEYIEYEENGLDADFIEEEDVSVSLDRSGRSYTFDWNVPKKYAKRSQTFTASAGEHIRVAVMLTPSNIPVRVGIVQPDGVRKYVSGSNVISYTFTLTQSGSYCIYVQNMSTTTAVEASGAYGVE